MQDDGSRMSREAHVRFCEGPWVKLPWSTHLNNTGVTHYLHYLNVSDEECKIRLRRRNEDGSHRFKTSETEFDRITQYFVAPSHGEGFNVLEE